jgi:VCBS repeat-containing protein
MIKGRSLVTALSVMCAAMISMMSFSVYAANKNKAARIKGAVVEKAEVQAQPYWDPAAAAAAAMKAAGGAGGAGGPGGGPGGPPGGGVQSTPSVYIDNGEYSAEKSKTSFVSEGDIKDAYGSNVKISAKEGNIGGVYVKGAKSQFTLTGADIELSGNGSGLGGTGSGAASDDHSTLILRNVNITTNGEARSATSAENYSTLIVNNSTLIAHGVPFDSISTTPPTALAMQGNARAHVTMSNSESYFNNSTIIADGWGALSTDASGGYVYIEANHCDIQTLKSGYGTYADHYCIVAFNDCRVTTATYTAIVDKNGKVYLKDVNATSGKYCALMHNSGMPATTVSTLEITRGRIITQDAVILASSTNTNILFDGVKVFSKNGVLIQSKVNDIDLQSRPSKGQKVYGIHATFRDMYIEGDFVHKDPERSMWVNLESTTLKGAIKDDNVYITLDPGSKWTSSSDSKVTIVSNFDLAQIDAPKGVTITAVAGESGTYTLAGGGTLLLKKF